MQRTINVCGIGHKKGTTRAGKAYDFHVISGTYADPDYTSGQACAEFAVDESVIAGITTGMDVKVIYHYFNGKTFVDGIIPV